MSVSWLTAFQNLGIWSVYLSIAAIAVWEYRAPRRALTLDLRLRWINNISLFIFNTVLIRLVGPALAVVFAYELQQSGWGFFNIVDLPEWFTIVSSFVLLDFCFYLKHRIAHCVPWFWRFHRVHHSDADFDVTTSLRFHPLDVAYQIALQLLAVLVIGAPPVAVATYIIVFMVVSRLQHGNIYVPESVDRALRIFIVTADMHRIHHSARLPETNSNYGGVLPWHDKLLNTYIAEPCGGHTGMQIGLLEFNKEKDMTLKWMLLNPLLTAKALSESPPAQGKHAQKSRESCRIHSV